MKIVIAPKFVKFITMSFASAITFFPYIFVSSQKSANDSVLLNHEKIHLKQQKDLFIIPFYILYVGSYFINLLKYKNHKKAYLNIPFEKEAYSNQENLNYLKKTGKIGALFSSKK